MRALIEVHNASLIYRDGERTVYALRQVNARVDPGEFIGILGPSGSGKSSLLYLLSGLKLASEGEAYFRGQSYRAMGDAQRSYLRRARFGFIFQQPYLLGYLTVLENVLLAAPKPKAHLRRAVHLLEALGLSDKLHRYPSALSGGEKQRVCIARALLMEPEVIFADEPTAFLDLATGLNVIELLEACRGDGAVVLVTHDPAMLKYANRVYRLRDGKVVEADDQPPFVAAGGE